MPPRPRQGKAPTSHGPANDYVELRARSAFSFLEGASNPEDLVQAAADLDYPALALADRDGVYGSPRFHTAARDAGLRGIVGAEVFLGAERRQRLRLLVESPRGWRGLGRRIERRKHGRRCEWPSTRR